MNFQVPWPVHLPAPNQIGRAFHVSNTASVLQQVHMNCLNATALAVSWTITDLLKHIVLTLLLNCSSMMAALVKAQASP